ncbi:hypothetical protein OESDEN_08314 [Oesophagostomum dentatum]|uniref:Uncharacterized protein n=1 Tax=Oesophagostomum dentatum TaxID=61180 RepID=A0A0B1T6P4_OESDE|nr:hypothetical protein OESDEN_08314 [Oesophagostomum dentatum]
MLSKFHKFLLGTALALAQVPDCKTGYQYREELFSNVKQANPSMKVKIIHHNKYIEAILASQRSVQ